MQSIKAMVQRTMGAEIGRDLPEAVRKINDLYTTLVGAQIGHR